MADAKKPVPGPSDQRVKVLRAILDALRFVNKQIGGHPAATAELDKAEQVLTKLEHPEPEEPEEPELPDDDEAKPKAGHMPWSKRHGKETPARY
jgi:hypothetical protein